MEECYPIEKNSPQEDATFISRLFFWWMKDLCYEGNTGSLDMKNLYRTNSSNKSATITDRFEKLWEKEIEIGKLRNKKPSLLRVIRQAYLIEFFCWGLLVFVGFVILRAAQPMVLSQLIILFTTGRYNIQDICLYGGGLCIITIMTTFVTHHTNCGLNTIGMKLRVSISSLVYRKILKLSQRSLGMTASGQVVNLLSNDVARFDMIAMGLNYLWIGPIQVVLVSYLMWTQVGPSSMAGLICMVIMTLPLQFFMGSITSKYRTQVAKRTDKRVKLMSELLCGIQVIKMYTWEAPFEKIVKNTRVDEVKYLTKTSYIRGILSCFMIFVERSTLAATVICYALLGHDVTADAVFSLAVFFNMLQLTLAIQFPVVISMGAESLVSIKRLETFLLLEEKANFNILPSEDNSIKLKNLEASWIPDNPTLKNFNLNLAPGTLCAVIGPVGSGKSSFLKLLLGELMANSGTVEMSGDISYASQEPWLFASTVRNNILFGEEFNRAHYRSIVKVCALERDFELFPEGDKTKVGDRGVSLSGGQRARINLARAVYRDSDIYLLDDPLSAVDTKVGRHLFDQCIVKFLRGKTRILVTHQLQYLKKADIIIVLNKGGIEAQGTFEELSQSDLDFTKLLVASEETLEESKETARFSTVSTTSLGSLTGDVNEDINSQDLMEDQANFKGSPFLAYTKSVGSTSFVVLVLFFFIFCQAILSGTDYWVTLWTNQQEIRSKAENNKILRTPNAIVNIELMNNSESLFRYDFDALETKEQLLNQSGTIPSFFQDLGGILTEPVIVEGQLFNLLKKEVLIYVYIIFIISMIIISVIRSLIYFNACMRASKNLHNSMFHCLLEAPMRFFDTSPIGRVLNRFSKDMGSIDELLPRALADIIQILLVMTGILVLVAITNVYMIIAMVILGAVFMKVRQWYISTARSLKLLEGAAKSPVFSYISSTIDGLTTIRSTKIENILMKQFDSHQDVHSSAWYLTILCSVCFGLWLDLICAFFVCIVVGGFVLLDQYSSVGGGFIGLAISESLILVGMLQYGMKQLSEVVNYLTSVERVLEYTQLDKEHPLFTQGAKPVEPWPNKGKISFIDMNLKYIPTDPPVIRNFNLEILPTEKIGIVGRTGAGKSSLIAALFHLAPIEGKILIDDIDTGTMGLRDIRKKISIIPQEPVLFSTTVRYNLDPFNEFSDDKLWEALEEVELKEAIDSLDFIVTEGGSNFSVGQRQLICLARAILRNNRILIMDEATANVDPKTDELIQKTIRKKFKWCTVLTIAHRLNTIMDSDKVLVMDSGCRVEFGHPHNLLQNSEGYFTKMLEETGPAMTQTLRAIAAESYERRRIIE